MIAQVTKSVTPAIKTNTRSTLTWSASPKTFVGPMLFPEQVDNPLMIFPILGNELIDYLVPILFIGFHDDQAFLVINAWLFCFPVELFAPVFTFDNNEPGCHVGDGCHSHSRQGYRLCH